MSSSNSRAQAGGAGAASSKSARSVAARVLCRVWEAGAFAAAALDAELSAGSRLDPRDAGLATELVYGVLRTQGDLERRILELASKKRPIEDLGARAHLLMGAYSICFLDRIPVFAAVSEAASGARASAGQSVVGFVNAVLRRLAADVEAKGRPALADAIVASAPGWLRGALRRSIGRAQAEAYLAAGPVPPPIGICLAPGENRDTWIEKLRAAAPGGSFEPGLASPYAILVRGAGDVRRLPGAGAAWIVQEEGAQLVALALGARPGDRALDACSGRGNKAWLLTHEVGPSGVVDAADLYPAKLEKLRSGPSGGRVRAVYTVDWEAGTGEVPAGYYDRVLVDAPCSGTGTLRRRPEIMIHRDSCDLARLADLQIAIARRAATRVRDGGRLVFAVCSVLREEAEDVVARLIEAPSSAATPGGSAGDSVASSVILTPAPFDSAVGQALAGSEAQVRLLPHVHGTDGYFIASFTVRAR